MRYLPLIALGAAVLSNPLPASAASVSAETGTLMVNSGEGYKILAAAEVQSGAQILVAVDGTAIIKYSANCSVRIGSGRVWTVAAEMPCLPTANFIDLTNASLVGAPAPPPAAGDSIIIQTPAPQGTPPAPTAPPPAVVPPPPPPPLIGPLALAAAGVAGVAGIAYAVSEAGKKNDTPASP